VIDAFSNFGFNVPLPAFDHVFAGFKYLGVILVTAVPFGIYDLVEAMDNVESAEAAGDPYPTTRVLTADGVVSLIGCLMGNPYINAVYIGHPGWKGMGGRIGYSAATGLMVIVLSWFGIIALLLAIVPVVAISPILLYIGMLIGAQAFQTTPKGHAPAIILALTPHIASWAKTLMDGALQVAGTDATKLGFDKLANVGVLYPGLQTMGGGAILTGLVLAAIVANVIDKKFINSAAFALAGAVLTFFGFMHGQQVGIAVTPTVAIAYLVVAVFLFALSRYPALAPALSLPQSVVASTPAE
jgi:adenine/guanine/hypoxanthine permease